MIQVLFNFATMVMVQWSAESAEDHDGLGSIPETSKLYPGASQERSHVQCLNRKKPSFAALAGFALHQAI